MRKSEGDEAYLLQFNTMQENLACYTRRKALNYHNELSGNTFYTEEARSGTDRVGMANHR